MKVELKYPLTAVEWYYRNFSKALVGEVEGTTDYRPVVFGHFFKMTIENFQMSNDK
jgi:hypothetical protein